MTTARKRGTVRRGAPPIAEIARAGYEAHAAALVPSAGQPHAGLPSWELVSRQAPAEVAAWEAAALAILETAAGRAP